MNYRSYASETFEKKYTYSGSDLGAVWKEEKTAFRLWAPAAQAVRVNLYSGGTEGADDCVGQLEMAAGEKGTWVAEKQGNLNGVYYTYSVTVEGRTVETCDPYARTTGINGKRAMIIDLASTNPEGWEKDINPNAGLGYTDCVIYELHLRDLSCDMSSGIRNKGKFLGLIETGTVNSRGVPTGLDHIKSLGITHLHLLPVYDFGSVDESRLDREQFNWGYDPVNFNVPEGSYSTDPYRGEVRVREMKEMIRGLHKNGISVVMDVVYNHVYDGEKFCFNQIVPGYFSRGSNGSGCGNDTASERSMVRKYIVDSVKYWAEEYHIDGFRFDLAGLIDTQTIREIISQVRSIRPDVIFYGEGWNMPTELTKPGFTLTTQENAAQVPGFAFFSDTMRDLLRGSVFDSYARGYVSGAEGLAEGIGRCFLGMPGWTEDPSQIVNYASCHDNMTLFDRITLSAPEASQEERVRMHNLAAAICMTAQGIPFLQAGEELLRSKPLPEGGFDENSYASPDSVNSLKWDTLDREEVDYYRGLIRFRRAHGALRMATNKDVTAHITQVRGLDDNVAAFHIRGGVRGEPAGALFVIFNPNRRETEVPLPEGSWNVCINGEKAGTDTLSREEGTVCVAPVCAMVLVMDGNA